MYTIGFGSEQYFYCGLCSAYAGKRVQKLAMQCDRKDRKVPAVERLRRRCHPTNGVQYDQEPRRLCYRDIGGRNWTDVGHTDTVIGDDECGTEGQIPRMDEAKWTVQPFLVRNTSNSLSVTLVRTSSGMDL